MAGTALPAAGYFTDALRTNLQAKTAQDDTLAFLRQSVAGTAAISELTIASGSITPTGCIHTVDTESDAATDDLTNAVLTNMVDGQLLILTGANSGRVSTVKHAAGGSGQFLLQDDTEYALDDENTIIFRLSGTSWVEVARNNGAVVAMYCGTAGGTANALTANANITLPALRAGMVFHIIPASTNTSATVTLNIQSFGTKNIKKSIGAGQVSLGIGDIVANRAMVLLYDGTNMLWLNPPTYSKGADIASAGTLDLTAATGDLVDITGTTGISAITLNAGQEVTCRFTGALTITAGASLILPSAGNMTTIAGDIFKFRGYASGVVRCVGWLPIAGAAALDRNQNFTKAQRGVPVQLTDAATVAVDLSLGNHFYLTIGGNRTLGQPTNMVAGQSGSIQITQDGTGSRTLAYHADWLFQGGTDPTLSTAAGAIDLLTYQVNQAGNKVFANLLKGFA